MRAVIQRVSQAKVVVGNDTIGKIDQGLMVLIGVTHDDTEDDANYLAKKISQMRIFEDTNSKMNLSLKDIDGSVLSISQFTLYSDTKKGRRPNFMAAAKPEQAERLYQIFNEQLGSFGIKVEKGKFGARMDVSLINDGPVTIIIDSNQQH